MLLDTALAMLFSCFLSFQRKLIEEAVRNCEQAEEERQEEDNVTIEDTRQNVLKHWR